MSAFRIMFPLLAATAAFAQSDCGESGSTTTIENNADATALAQACETYSGSIAMATGVAGNVMLDGITEIEGDLVISTNNEIRQLGGTQLEKIGGTFKLEADTQLGGLVFPELSSVGSIEWVSLASLTTLNLVKTITTAPSIIIRDTQLSNLNGINASTIDTLSISSNNFLQDFSIQVKNISSALTITENGDMAVVNFPMLEQCANITLSRVAAVNMSNLENVPGDLSFQGTMQNITVPKLESAGSLTIANCTELEEIDFSGLQSLGGGLLAGDNPKLTNYTFASLETVAGAVDITGNFTDVSTPALERVTGAFNLQSTEDINSLCDDYKGKTGEGRPIQGKFNCFQTDNPQNTTDGGNGGSRPNNDESAASNMGASAFIAITGVAMWALL